MLAKINGILRRFTIACCVSQLVERIASITKRDEKPNVIKKSAENVPRTLNNVICDVSKPRKTAIIKTIDA